MMITVHANSYPHYFSIHAIPYFLVGIIRSSVWGSFAVQFGDHLRSGIIWGPRIICGPVQNASLLCD